MRLPVTFPMGATLAATFADRVARYGDTTLVNGSVTRAIWERAQPGRITMFLGEDALGKPVYEVHLLPLVLNPPFELTVLSPVVWQGDGMQPWEGRCVTMDLRRSQDELFGVSAFVELVSR